MGVDAEAAFGGGVYIADKSVWARSAHPDLRDEWASALQSGQIVTCCINRIELLYSARTLAEFDELQQELRILRYVPMTDSICQAASAALRELAERSDGYHRVKPPDAILAATAQDQGLGVLHYDRHYDRLAEVMNFDSRWAAAAGSLD